MPVHAHAERTQQGQPDGEKRGGLPGKLIGAAGYPERSVSGVIEYAKKSGRCMGQYSWYYP
jgi:hypothetical protein